MSTEYKIAAVSPKQKHWQNKRGDDMVTYHLRLEGEGDEVIQLNKMAKSKAPEEGEVLRGDITDTEFGKKLTIEFSPPSHGGGGYQKSPEDKEDIARAVALKAAVEYGIASTDTVSDKTPSEVLKVADTFLLWLKNENPTKEAEKTGEDAPKKVDKVFGVDDEPISLDQIPF